MTRVADASLAVGVTAAAHSIVFQFTLTFRFPFDTVVEREPPPCSPFYCLRVISGSSTPRFRPNYLILWEIPRSYVRVQLGQESERSERLVDGLSFFFFFADLYPPRPRRQRGIKREMRESLTANLISPRNVRSRLFWTFVGLIEAN